MAYAFSKDLETGNLTIDSQHRELINAINKLLEACSKGQGRDQVTETANFLLNYTKKHFADEERLQVQSKYPDYVNHKKYHEEFVRVVGEMVKELSVKGPDIVFVGKINSAVAGWLINHIKREDVRVAAHVKGAS